MTVCQSCMLIIDIRNIFRGGGRIGTLEKSGLAIFLLSFSFICSLRARGRARAATATAPPDCLTRGPRLATAAVQATAWPTSERARGVDVWISMQHPNPPKSSPFSLQSNKKTSYSASPKVDLPISWSVMLVRHLEGWGQAG